MNEKNNFVVIAFDDDWERHSIIWEGQCLHSQSAWEMFQAAVDDEPSGYKQYNGQTVTLVALDEGCTTSKAYMNVVTKVEVEYF